MAIHCLERALSVRTRNHRRRRDARRFPAGAPRPDQLRGALPAAASQPAAAAGGFAGAEPASSARRGASGAPSRPAGPAGRRRRGLTCLVRCLYPPNSARPAKSRCSTTRPPASRNRFSSSGAIFRWKRSSASKAGSRCATSAGQSPGSTGKRRRKAHADRSRTDCRGPRRAGRQCGVGLQGGAKRCSSCRYGVRVDDAGLGKGAPSRWPGGLRPDRACGVSRLHDGAAPCRRQRTADAGGCVTWRC